MLLDGIDWEVRPASDGWCSGRNGSGKTSLLRIASLYLHPSAGEVEVLGERLGRTDVRTLRARIGSGQLLAVGAAAPGPERALDVVMTAKHAALEPWWHRYDDADRARAALAAGPRRRRRRWRTASSARCRRASSSGCSSPAR